MIYTEEDLEQAYVIGYNEAVDDVNAYIEQESMEFILDESYDNDDDYSSVEDAIMNETKSWKKKEHTKAIIKNYKKISDKYNKGRELSEKEKERAWNIEFAGMKNRLSQVPVAGSKLAPSPYLHVKTY